MQQPPAEERIGVEVRITGRVQGVWFRAWTRDEAIVLGLEGWVRNEPDGSVAALFLGPRTAVTEMLARCHHGPPLARVDALESRKVEPVPEADGFRIDR